jgi:5-methylcytosine-specific restriction endonuclease McrA
MVEQLDTTSIARKTILYERAGGRCEFSQGCNVVDTKALTIDHRMSRRMASLLGWSDERTNSVDNLQLLCERHHNLKDTDTPARIRQLIAHKGLPWFKRAKQPADL